MNLLVVSGSIREGRTTHKVAKAIAKTGEVLGANASVLDLKTHLIPQFGAPATLDQTNIKAEIEAMLSKADVMIFATPEYNGFFSSALKSLFDSFPNSFFAGKVIGTATVSTGGMGGMRAAQNLQTQILGISGYPNPKMMLTGNVNDKFDENEQVTDENYQEKLNDFVGTILAHAKQMMK